MIRQQRNNSLNKVEIYLFGVSQYVVQAGWQETLFVLEEDAQRYARHLSGSQDVFPIHHLP